MIKENLNTLIADAMKSKDQVKLKVLRLVKAEFQKYETTKDNKGNLNSLDSEAKEIKILKKMLSQWEEETMLFEQAHRDTSTLIKENNYLKSLIPKEPSKEEQEASIKQIIETYLKNIPVEERKNMKHLGAIMKIVKSECPSAEGKNVSTVYKNMIGL